MVVYFFHRGVEKVDCGKNRLWKKQTPCGKNRLWKKQTVEKVDCGKNRLWKKETMCGKSRLWKKQTVEKWGQSHEILPILSKPLNLPHWGYQTL